jgi:hypothetical protein
MHGRDAHKLAGTSATLYENGRLKTLASYSHSVREGPVRVWNEEKRLVLYSQYKENKKHGVTCLLSDGSPWLVQEWKEGKLLSESVVARNAQGDWQSVDDPKKLAEAQKLLAAVEADLKEIETDVRKNLREETEEDEERIGKLKAKTNHAVNQAKIKAEYQKERKEEAAVVAGAHPHPYSPIGGAAQAEEHSAAVDEKADNRDAKAKEKNAKKTVQGAVKAEAKHDKELHGFALAALERSL